MAYSAATISSAEIAAMDAGKVCFVVTNALRRRTRTPVWSSSGLWSNSATQGVGSNLTDTSWPTRYLYDDILYNPTRPASGAVGLSTVYLLLDLVPGTDANQTTDVVWFRPNNFANVAGSVTATLQIADDQDFATNAISIATWSAWDRNEKGIDARLGATFSAPQRYTNLQFARLKIDTDAVGGFTLAALPEVNELVLGRRRQLARLPRMPWDPEPSESRVDWFEADEAGVVGGDVRWMDRFHATLKFRATTSSALGIDEVATLRAWKDDCVTAECFHTLFIDQFDSGTGVYEFAGHCKGHYCYPPDPSLIMPYIAQYQSVQEAELEFVELAPFESSES